MATTMQWTAQDGTTVHLLMAAVSPVTPLVEFWLIEQHPHRDDAFVRVLKDGSIHATRDRDNDWAPVYVEAARLALGYSPLPKVPTKSRSHSQPAA